MEKKKDITATEAFNQSEVFMTQNEDRLQLDEFRNRLRQGMTSEWSQSHGSTQVKDWSGYANRLERELFEILYKPE